MDDRTAVAWIHRRIGLGLSPDQLGAARARGVDAELADLVSADPGANDPWASVEVSADPKATGAQKTAVVGAWVDHLTVTTTPFADRVAWLLHGWLVSSMDKARSPAQMVNQIRLFRAAGLGSFPELLRAVTTDPAMLVYLDGRESTGSAPNENFGRELLELFALGVGNYGEADVKAGARALTGWTTGAGEVTAVFRRNRHDDTPQRYLGTDGVHDVDTVIAAAVAHPAHPRFVARRVARELLSTLEDPVVGRLATVYDDNGRRLDAVIAAAVRLGLDGAGSSVVLAPVPWLAMARRSTGATLPAKTVARGLGAAGQIPLFPPNVGGWPGGSAWFASATVVARANLAAALAAGTAADHPTLAAAGSRDLGLLADRLGVPTGSFGPATTAALLNAPDPRPRLALALVSPEFVIA